MQHHTEEERLQPESANKDVDFTLSTSEVSPYLESLRKDYDFTPRGGTHATNEKNSAYPLDDKEIAKPSTSQSPLKKELPLSHILPPIMDVTLTDICQHLDNFKE